MELKVIAEAIKKQKKVVIITHTNPDGDALGSSFALKYMLIKMGIEAEVMLDAPMPYDFEFTKWKNIVFEKSTKESCVIGVDAGVIGRFGVCGEIFQNAETKIILDHHLTNKNECELFYSDPAAAATGEIIYRLLKLLEIKLEEKIATALYISIMSDTGGCKFGNTTSETHLILADLISFVDNAYLNRMLFDIITLEKLKLQCKLVEDLEAFEDGKINAITAKKDVIKNEHDLDGVVNIAVNIEGAKAGVLFKEKAENEIKVSIRTVGEINAMEICANFSGGGHKNAAGCTIFEPLDKAKELFISKLKEQI